jgi:hypothetical protein
MRSKPIFLRTIIAILVLGLAGLAFGQQAQTPPAAPVPPTPAPAAPATPGAQTPPAAAGDALTPPDPNQPDPSAADTEGAGGGGLSVGEIPAVETEELTPDLAKKALDAYVVVHDKYQDSPLENYDNLQDFVDKDPKGKNFEADVKGFGFANVNDWNLAVTTLSFAYTNVLDDQTSDIKQQIEEITADTEMAQDMKDRMIKSLKAMIPSDNNRKIVDDLIKDSVYGEKIKQLETTEE